MYHKNIKEYISIHKILEINDFEIGLIGPGNSYLTHILETIFGHIDIFHRHSILHDAFGRFYQNYHLDRGYCYVIPEKYTLKCMKSSPFCGQLFGIIHCL